jgi:hypothetical protein
LGVAITVFACLVKCTLLQLVYVLEVLPYHLEQPWVSVDSVVLFSRRVLRGYKAVPRLMRGRLL